jgi:hypothetical protein
MVEYVDTRRLRFSSSLTMKSSIPNGCGELWGYSGRSLLIQLLVGQYTETTYDTGRNMNNLGPIGSGLFLSRCS